MLKAFLIFTILSFSIIAPSMVFAETDSVEVNGKAYTVEYTATGLEVLGLDTDDQPPTLIILMSTTDVQGTLEVVLDRSFLDAKADDGSDDEFLVLIDGLDTTFAESSTSTQRVLQIQIPPGTISVDIIGTDFGLAPVEEPAEEPTEAPVVEPEETTEEPPVQETPEMSCGPGTILVNGQCVVEQVTPPVETPETPMEESVCGPGTVLKDGACVLDQSCGPGTILINGQCVLDESAPEPKSTRGMAFEFVAPMVAAFIVAMIVMIVLWGIGKAGRKKN